MSTSGGSKETLEQALDAARNAGDAPGQARILRELAALERAEGHDWRARRLLERSLDIYRETNDLRGVTAVMGELEPVADAEGDGSEADADLITMPAVEPSVAGPGTAPPKPEAPRPGRLSPTAPPGGSRREGTSWPMAVGFLVLLLVVAGGLAFLAVRLVGDFLGNRDDTETATDDGGVRVPVEVEPSPQITRLPVEEEGEKPATITVTPQSCDVTGSDVFSEVRMRVRLRASEPFQVVVLRGTLTARGGREIGNGIMPVTPVARGTRRIDMTFTVFRAVPGGRLTCGVEIQTAVPAF